MAAEPVPSFVHHNPNAQQMRLILDWLDDVVRNLPWEIEAGLFAPGIPERLLRLIELETNFLTKPDISYDDRDHAWTTIVGLAATDDRQGEFWRILAIYLVLGGLKKGYWLLGRYTDIHERQDIQADMIEGFLIRLKKIDTDRHNIAGRLIGSARGNARLHYQRRHPKNPHPDKGGPEYLRFPDWDTALLLNRVNRLGKLGRIKNPDLNAPPIGEAPDSINAAISDLAETMEAADEPVQPIDLELISRTRVDGQTLKDAAADLGLDREVAYKRRQTAEKRIAAVYHINVRRGTHKPASDTANPNGGNGL